MRYIIVLVLVSFFVLPFVSFAQTNLSPCTTVVTPPNGWYYDFIAPTPEGCLKPNFDPNNVSITKSGYYTCIDNGQIYSDVRTSVEGNQVRFTFLCPKLYGITKSTFQVTVKFGVGGSGGGTTLTPGYYCDRTDPVKPFCKTHERALDSYPQCLASCKPSRNWVDIIVSPFANKYKTGQIVTFSPKSNLTLNRVDWSFDDNINRPNEPVRDEPVVYTQSGRKTITLSALDPTTNKTISTSTTIKIKCVPAAGSTDDPATIFSYLSNYQPIKIAYDDLRSFVADNAGVISNHLSVCQVGGAGSQNALSAVEGSHIIDYLTSYTHNRKMAVPISLAIVTNYDLSFVGLSIPTGGIFTKIGRYQPLAFHAEVALDFWNSNGQTGDNAIYTLKLLDPNGPKITNLNCQPKQVKVGPAIYQPILICDFNYGRVDLGITLPPDQDANFQKSVRWIIYDPRIIDATPLNVDSLAGWAVRGNTAKYLENNYPLIDNRAPEFGDGVCAAWSDFALQAAYLGNFVGECNTIPTAYIPQQIASTGLLDFLNSLFQQLLRPILIK